MQQTTKLFVGLHGDKTYNISTDEDPGLRIESFAVINLRGVSTNKSIITNNNMKMFVRNPTVYRRFCALNSSRK
jgi:hypothetical protein